MCFVILIAYHIRYINCLHISSKLANAKWQIWERETFVCITRVANGSNFPAKEICSSGGLYIGTMSCTVYEAAMLAVALTNVFSNSKEVFISRRNCRSGCPGLLCARCISNDSERTLPPLASLAPSYSSSTVLRVTRVTPAPQFQLTVSSMTRVITRIFHTRKCREFLFSQIQRYNSVFFPRTGEDNVVTVDLRASCIIVSQQPN